MPRRLRWVRHGTKDSEVICRLKRFAPAQDLVLFESNLSSRMYKLNRPKKLNSLNREMIDLLRPKIDVSFAGMAEWLALNRKLIRSSVHDRLGKNPTYARSSLALAVSDHSVQVEMLAVSV